MANDKKTDVGESMDRTLKVFLATALIALPLGFFVGNAVADTANGETTETASMDDGHSHGDKGAGHAHEPFAVAAEDAPAIDSLEVTKDPKTGWNLHMHTSNFTFAPESASGDHVDGQGHAHIYVDGEKITRLYGGDYYLGELSEGEHTIKVTLNTNDHKDYAVNGETVAAEVSVTDMHHADDEEKDSHSDDDGHSH